MPGGQQARMPALTVAAAQHHQLPQGVDHQEDPLPQANLGIVATPWSVVISQLWRCVPVMPSLYL